MNSATCVQVEGQHPVELLERVVLDLHPPKSTALVVDQHVDPAVCRHRIGDDAPDVGLDRDVAADQRRVAAGRALGCLAR